MDLGDRAKQEARAEHISVFSTLFTELQLPSASTF